MKVMKTFRAGRFLPVFLGLCLAAGLSGCENPPLKDVSSVSSDSEISSDTPSAIPGESDLAYPFLQEMLSDSPDYFDSHLPGDGILWINRDFLDTLYETISKAALTKIEYCESLNYYEPDALTLYHYEKCDDYPVDGISIYPPTTAREVFCTETVLSLPGDGAPEYYTGPAGLYDEIRMLYLTNTAEKNFSLAGEYTLLQTPLNETGEWLDCYFEMDGRIAFLQGHKNLHVFNAKSGELLYSIESPDMVFRAEPHEGGIRLLTETAVADYDRDGAEIGRQELAEDIQTAIRGTYGLDSTLRYDIGGGRIAYPAEDGIYLWENGVSKKVLDNAALPKIVQREQHYSAEFAERCVYSDPQLLSDGTRLCAVVNLFNSQNGYSGLVIKNLETGEDTYFWSLFGILRSGMEIRDDNIICTFSEAGITMIDAATLERSLQEWIPTEGMTSFAWAPDGKRRFQTRQYRDGEGNLCQDISLLDEKGESSLLCTASGENSYREAATEHYIIYRTVNNGIDYSYTIAAIPY